jgi:hypothetical protein
MVENAEFHAYPRCSRDGRVGASGWATISRAAAVARAREFRYLHPAQSHPEFEHGGSEEANIEIAAQHAPLASCLAARELC